MSYPPPMAPEYVPQPYQQGFPSASPPKTGIVTAGLVFGIVGIVLCWVPVLGFFIGVPAIVFSAIALSKAVRKGKPITGLVLGILTVFINAIVVAALGSSAAPSTPAAALAEAAPSTPAAAEVEATTASASPAVTTPAVVATVKPKPVVTTKAPAPVAPLPVVETESEAKPAIDTSFGDGSYEVGIDVAPGKYKSSGATEGIFEFCSVSTKNSKGDMVDWETANANEQVLITIKRGQTVEASGCEEFRKR
jgi:hypothetical protein